MRSPEVMKRRAREGVEFFRSLTRERKESAPVAQAPVAKVTANAGD